MPSPPRLGRSALAFLTLAILPVAVPACRGDGSTEADAARARLQASAGGRMVLRAIEAVGGLEAWYATPTSAYAWEYSNEDSNIRFKSYLVADNRTRHIYHDLLELGTPEAPRPIEGRFAWDGERAWIYPPRIDGINPRFWSSTGFYFSSIPFVLADPGLTYEALPDETLDGRAYDMVRVGYEPGIGDASDTYTLYIDKESERIRAIRYTVTYGGRPARGETLFYYDDYVTVDGLTVPTRFRGYRFEDGERGAFRNEAWVSDISFRQPFDESRLRMPEGARIQPLPEG